MKIKITAICAIATLAVCHAQGPDMSTPTELDQLNFMVGNWTGDDTYSMQGQEMKGHSDIECKRSIGNRFFELTMKSSMAGMNSEGREFIGYNKEGQKFTETWFDSMGGTPTVMTGTLAGGALSVTSEKMHMENIPGEMYYRSITSKVDDDNITVQVDTSADGTTWSSFLKGSYHRVKAGSARK